MKTSTPLKELEERTCTRRTFLGAAAALGLATLSGLPRRSGAVGTDEWAMLAANPDRSGAQPDVLVRGGRLVTEQTTMDADLRIRGGRIAEIGRNLANRGAREIDARGQLVLPGGIDPHVHLHLPGIYERIAGGRWVDDFTSGSRAALAGGITTIGNITFPKPGERLVDAVERETSVVAQQAIADVMLHPVVGAPSWASLLLSLFGITRGRSLQREIEDLPALARRGHPSIKVFMNFPGFDASFQEFPRLLRAAREAGVLTMIHCEDLGTINAATERLRNEGRDSLRHFAESRPAEAEERATRQAVSLCKETGAPIYIVHLSSRAALRVCAEAQAQGLPVYVETRPLYLHLTEEKLLGPEGQKYIGDPPLRQPSDMEALWEGLATGTVHTVGSDHVGWTLEQKLDPALDFETHRPGMSNLQVMLPMLYSEGVHKRRISVERFVAVTSSNAARLFGLYPRKGTIRVGSDADLVIWDTRKTKMIRREDVLSRAGFSIYEGTDVTGWPRLVLRRGRVVHNDGQSGGLPGTGRLVERTGGVRPGAEPV